MDNENPRFQPYRRQRAPYRSWLRLPDPVPPPATRDRMNARRLVDLGLNNMDRHQQQEAVPNALPPQVEADNNFVNEPMDHQGEIPREPVYDSDSSIDSEVLSEHSGDSSLHANYESEEEQAMEAEAEDQEENMADLGPERDPDLEEPLYPGGDCTKFECLLMVLSFSLRHGLSQTATKDLCSMINSILRGDYLPSTKFKMSTVFGRSKFIINFYCKRCQTFIVSKTNGSKMHDVIPCQVCATECKLKVMNDGYFFVTFSVKDQLKYLLENTDNVMALLDHKFTRPKPPQNVMTDIYDGKVYSELSQEGNFLSRPGNLSLTFNTDGVQVFETAGKKSLWPIFFRINEFPPSVRFNFNNCLLGGMWFEKSEPNMHLFLSNFVQELDQLYEDGFFWESSDGIQVKSKVILLNCVVDSKAKFKVQNCKAHNGYFGCGFCDHPGKMFEGSKQAKYPLNDDLALLVDNSFHYTVDARDPISKEPKVFTVVDRNRETIRTDMELAEANRNEVGEGDIKGVKGKSVLMGLPYFDLVYGFPVDYLHAVLLGTTKHVTDLWFDSTSYNEMYYVGRRIGTVNKRIKNITPPVSLSRRPRSLSERKLWHGNEWRSWLLYYSLPVLDGLLPKRYLRHHCLFVSAVFLLLKNEISSEDVERATFYLGSYCREFQILYEEHLMYFNLHLNLHLGKCVDLWGPLYGFSAFPFEGANGKLVKLVHGTRGVLNQIAEKYSKCKSLPKVLSMYDVRENTLKFCEDLMTYHQAKVAYQFDSVTVLGALKSFPLEEDEREAFVSAGCNVISESYERMIIKNVMYHARCYVRKGDKSDSSVVQLTSGIFGVIERIIDPLNLKNPPVAGIHILFREINTLPREAIVQHHSGARAEHIIRCTPVVLGNLSVINVNNIKQLAILMDCIENTFVTTFPNMFEKD